MSENSSKSPDRPTLYGELAKTVWQEAMAETDPTQQRVKLIQADAASSQRERELEGLAKEEPRGWLTNWMCHMPIKPRQMMILARIYSFQVQAIDKPCRLPLASLAHDVGMQRNHCKEALVDLEKAGYVDKITNGARKPATYLVVVPRCMEAAINNGWQPVRQPAPKSDGKETAHGSQKDA